MANQITTKPINYTPLLLPNNSIDKLQKSTKKPPRWNGFQNRPEDINLAGRPKRKTLTELIYQKLEKMPTGWEDLTKLVLYLLFNKKDKDILKELWHYMDGMPKQSTELSTKDGQPLITFDLIQNVFANKTNRVDKSSTETKASS
jgi:hypothetical protein